MEEYVSSLCNSFTRVSPFGDLCPAMGLQTQEQIDQLKAVSRVFKFAAPLVSFDLVNRTIATQVYGFELKRLEAELASLRSKYGENSSDAEPEEEKDGRLRWLLHQSDQELQRGIREICQQIPTDENGAELTPDHFVSAAHTAVRINARQWWGPYPISILYALGSMSKGLPPLFTVLRRALEIAQGVLELHNLHIPVGDVADSVVIVVLDRENALDVAKVTKYGLLPTKEAVEMTWDQHVIQDARSFGICLAVLLFGTDKPEEIVELLQTPEQFLFDALAVVTADDYPFVRGLLNDLMYFPTKEGDPAQLFRDVIEKQLRPALLKCAIADPEGRKFWAESFGAECFSVPWCDFMPKMLEYLHIELGHDTSLGSKVLRLSVGKKELRCVRAILTRDCSPELDTSSAVTADKFGRLCDLFGPFQMSGEIFANAVSLMQEPWFHGELSHKDSAALVTEPGMFLVRFSNSQRDKFTIVTPGLLVRVARVIGPYGQVEYRPKLPRDEYATPFRSLVEVIHTLRERMRLYCPAPGSRFFTFFTQKLEYVSKSEYINDL